VKRAVIRLPSEVVDRLDRLAEELRVAHPGASYSRASVVRALISSGLTLAGAHRDRLLEDARRGASTPEPHTPEPHTPEPHTPEPRAPASGPDACAERVREAL
jgi:hypothetical protein